MIRLKTLSIEEFRGVRKLTLDLSGNNFAICGPNGTGKSGVVDAIEFCLTGDVTRLSGPGTAGLSVKEHSPHVDQHKHPEKAIVTISAEIPSIGKVITLKRSVKNPQKVDVTPDNPQIRAVVDELQTHPEFALSRREIAKYIITPPGDRSKDVQTLLRLDRLEKMRTSITSFNNSCDRQAKQDENSRATAETDLRTCLTIAKLERALVLARTNEKRKILGLADLAELTKDTNFLDGLPMTKDGSKKPEKDKSAPVQKKVALADLEALRLEISAHEPADLSERMIAAKEAFQKLIDDESLLALARRQGFMNTGFELISEDACPLCDTPWSADELREHLRNKLLNAQEITLLLKKLDEDISAVTQQIMLRLQATEHALRYCKSLTPPIINNEIAGYIEMLTKLRTALAEFQQDHAKIKPALVAVSASWWSPDEVIRSRFEECYVAVKALPDVATEQEARDYLVVAQDRYRRLLDTTKTAKRSKANAEVAKKVLEHYNKSCTGVLEAIYDKVAKDFSSFYRIINRDDEDAFVGKLIATPAKLSFDVDFYGRGLFPPGAYHSEGHQDGMGLCLYLALMKHTLGDRFTFAVLDDVLMSVDTGHRREVCRLLKNQFPKTQFILTTHDRVWLQYMKTENLVSRSQSFSGWSVTVGPKVWDDTDIWSEIEGELKKNDVAKSAWLLRRYLEYTASFLADNLRARVEFRGDAHYDLGDLLQPVLTEWRRSLEKGEKAAKHWKKDTEVEVLKALRTKATELIARTNVEQWAINPSVHFNEWANFTVDEFRDVLIAFKDLLQELRCGATCKSYVYLSPRKGKAEALRCNCGAIAINIKDG